MTTASAPNTEPTRANPAAHNQDLIRRAQGAYLGLAIGDALGATVEFMTPREIQHNHGVHNRIRGGGWLKLKPGQVTDDTTMSLALGESILVQGKVEAQAVAEAFSNWMRAKPVDIGNTVRRGIVRYRNSDEFRVPYDDNNAGNGACMRVLPVALATLGAPPTAMRDAVLDQAHVTHNARLSDEGTLCMVELIQAALKGACRLELETRIDEFAERIAEFRFRRRRIENPSGFIVDTLQAVFQSFVQNGDFESALVDVVNRGGDADTTGAILGALSGAVHGDSGIPKRWRDAVDATIIEQCKVQARTLISRSPFWKNPHSFRDM